MARKDISPAALDALRSARVDGVHVRLTCGQLDRKVYAEVNDVLTRVGGKWKGGKVMAHVFADDPSAALASVLDDGEKPAKNPDAFFPTPAPVVAQMLAALDLNTAPAGFRALEPSVGDGAIAAALRAVRPDVVLDAVEIHAGRAERARAFVDGLSVDDFTMWAPADGTRYDRIAMNPPFTAPGDALAYITHIRRAARLLAPGGVLVAIAPQGFTFRDDQRCAEFRAWVREHSPDGGWREIAHGAFTESGTGVGTCLVTVRAGEVPA